MPKSKVFTQDGVHWFSQAYAAQLLGTTRGKIKTMVTRELIGCHPTLGDEWISESDVNHLRHHPEEHTNIKKQLREPAWPKRGEAMPKGTIYKGDPVRRGAQFKGRIGHPLKDSPET